MAGHRTACFRTPMFRPSVKTLIRLASRARGPTPRATARFCFTARTLNALFTFRTDGRVRFRAAHHHRCRRHSGGLCQPVRRDRPGARHGDARGVRRIRWPRVACVASRCCSSTTRPSRSASGWNCARIFAACSRAGGSFPKWRGRANCISLLRAAAIDGLSIGFRTSRARIDPKTRIRRLHAVDLWEISHRHLPAARGSACARGEASDLKGEAVMRPHACRAGVGEDNRRSAPAVN